MTSKQIDVTCPCCSSKLTVDVLTRKVLRSAQPEELDEAGRAKLDTSRWDSANKRIADRTASGDDRLDAALDKERERKASMEERFRQASDRAQSPVEEDD